MGADGTGAAHSERCADGTCSPHCFVLGEGGRKIGRAVERATQRAQPRRCSACSIGRTSQPCRPRTIAKYQRAAQRTCRAEAIERSRTFDHPPCPVASQPQLRKQRQCNSILSKSSGRSEHDVVVGAVLTNPPIALRDRLEELHAVKGLLTPHSVECAQRHVSHVAWYPSHRSPHSRCCHVRHVRHVCDRSIAHASHAALYTAHRDECAALLQR